MTMLGDQGVGMAGQAPAKIAWKLLLLAGLTTGLIWAALVFNQTLQLLAGIVPILSGIYVGRKVTGGRPLFHGFLLGIISTVTALAVIAGIVMSRETLPRLPAGRSATVEEYKTQLQKSQSAAQEGQLETLRSTAGELEAITAVSALSGTQLLGAVEVNNTWLAQQLAQPQPDIAAINERLKAQVQTLGALNTSGENGLVALQNTLFSPPFEVVPIDKQAVLMQYGGSALFMLLPFPLYGVFITSRTAQRKKELQEQMDKRGGRLERPGRVVSVEDLQTLNLSKFASYVIELFKRNGFKINDYVFDKDSHVDIRASYNDEPWLLRCTVSDKVKQGMVQEFAQQKLKEEQVSKGVLLTSTEFMESARKWAAGRRELVTVDGATLIQMSQNAGTPPE